MRRVRFADASQPPPPLAGAVIWVPFLALISILNSGYRYFCDNHALQIARVRTILDPGLFPGDPFAQTLSGFLSWVWSLVAHVSQWVDLELVLAVFFLVGRLLLVYSCARLARSLLPESKIAPLIGAFLASLVPQSILADGNLTEVYFEQTSLFMGFFLLALAGLLEGRPMFFFVLWGIAFVANPLYGSFAFLFFVVTYLADVQRPVLVDMAKRAPVFMILALPMLVSSVRVFLRPSPSRDLTTWVNRLLNSPHLAPETWDPVFFKEFAAFVIVLLVSALVVRKRLRRVSSLMLVWCGFGVGALGLGTLASITEWGLALLPLQLARATDLFYLSAGVAATSAAGFWAENRASGVALAVASLPIGAVAYLLAPSFREPTVVVFAFGAISAALLTLIATHSNVLRSDRQRSFTNSASVVVLSCLLVIATTWTAAGSLLSRREALGSLKSALIRGPDPQVREIADWARESTAPDALFFHDPIAWEWAQFRYLAERPAFVTWKDGAAVQWDPQYAEEWSQRFAAMGFRGRWRDRWNVSKRGKTARIRRSLRYQYSQLNDGDLQKLDSAYPIDYWIAPKRVKSTWPVVFRTRDYLVFEVPGS